MFATLDPFKNSIMATPTYVIKPHTHNHRAKENNLQDGWVFIAFVKTSSLAAPTRIIYYWLCVAALIENSKTNTLKEFFVIYV